MAVDRASDNPFPSVLFEEHVDPSNPAASHQRLFVDTDHLLKMIDSSGTVTTFNTGASGLTDPMTTRGDIIVRNSSNVTARLAVGAAGTVLSGGTDPAWAVPMPVAHGCKISRDTSDQTLGNNTFTAVQWNATDTIDTDSMHDPSSNNTRITIPSITGVTTGLWEFVTHGYTTATSPRTDMKLRKGGSTDYEIVVGPTTVSGVGAFNGSWLVVLSAGDYIELMLRTTGGSFSLVATDSTALPFLMAKFLGKVS